MKLSRYTLFVDDYPEAGKSLAYNTRTQALLVINASIRSLLDEMPFAVSAVDETVRPILLKLEELGITMRDEADELDIVRDWFQTIRYNSKKLEAYILTSYLCNFACPYCFEGQVKEQKKFLKKEKADEIIAWIKNKAMEVNPEKAEVVFYGGEPLMNIPIMEYVSKELHDWFAKTPWKFEFTMITNGSLLTPELVDRLNPVGLKYVRITIDGDKEFHDQYRPYVGGKGSFDVIMKNMKAIAGKTPIALVGNFNARSYESVYSLLDRLEAEGLKEHIAMVDFKPITERAEPLPEGSHAEATYSCDPGHADKMLALKRELMKRGFKTSKALDSGGICHLKSASHQVIIDTDGLIFKCPAMVGHPERAVGNVSEEGLNGLYNEFLEFDLVEWKGKCGECKFLPFCAGGCNYHAELQTGTWKNVFCEKEFFDQTIQDYIKIKYEQIRATKREKAV